MALPKPGWERLAFGGGGDLQRRVGTARNGQKFGGGPPGARYPGVGAFFARANVSFAIPASSARDG